jgi:hypothetical protein
VLGVQDAKIEIRDNSSAAAVAAFMEEGFYDGLETLGQMPTDLMLRKQAYWTFFAKGLAGYVG